MEATFDSVEEDDGEFIPVEVMEAANVIALNLLPIKSRQLYTKRYNDFKTWRSDQKIRNSFAEEVLLVYFEKLSQSYCSSTLWAYYSMLKSCIQAYDKIDIGCYNRLISFIKQKHKGYKAKKSKVFTVTEVARFCAMAPDDKFLVTKVIFVIGISGCCRRKELTDLTVDNVLLLENMVLVTIPYTKTYVERSFTVVGEFFRICKNYMNMRPANVTTNRFFLSYRCGKLINLPVGINTVGSVPKAVATFLSLAEPEKYTSHCIRRTSATVYVDSGADESALKRFGKWKSNAVAQGYVEDSIANKKKVGEQITKAICPEFVSASTAVSPTISRPQITDINSVSTSSSAGLGISASATVPLITSKPLTTDSNFASSISASVGLSNSDLGLFCDDSLASAPESIEMLVDDSGINSCDNISSSSEASSVKQQTKLRRHSSSSTTSDVSSSASQKKIYSNVHRRNYISIQERSTLKNQSSSMDLRKEKENSSEFQVGNAVFKFYNCTNVTINVFTDKGS